MNSPRNADDILDIFDDVVPSEGKNQPKTPILERWELSEAEFTEIVDSNPSLRGVTLGYIAEWKFQKMFLDHPEVSAIRKDGDHDRKRKGDRTFSYKGKEIIVEVKSLQTNLVKGGPDTGWRGKSQVDASDCREVIFKDETTLKTTCLLRGEFDILAVNCYAFGNQWRFAFAKNVDLPQNTHKKYTAAQRQALLPTLIPVSWPPQSPFVTDIFVLLDELVAERERGAVPQPLAETVES
jgi:hypothetical protein